jgi:hypothetical protein
VTEKQNSILNWIGILRKVGIPTWTSKEISNANEIQIEPQIGDRNGYEIQIEPQIEDWKESDVSLIDDDDVDLKERSQKKKTKKRRRRKRKKNGDVDDDENVFC